MENVEFSPPENMTYSGSVAKIRLCDPAVVPANNPLEPGGLHRVLAVEPRFET